MSKEFIEQATEYASSHTKNSTKIIHAIGIIFIIFSLQILFSSIKITMPTVFDTDLAWILSLVLLGYYCKFQWKMAFSVAPILYVLNYAASLITSAGPNKGAFELFFLLFIFGAIAQFIGHINERSKTPFAKGIRQMLLSPLFLMTELFFYFSMMNSLYTSIYTIDQEEIDKMNQKRIDDNNEEAGIHPTEERRSIKRVN